MATVQQVGVHDIRLAEMDVRFQCLETANYEGVLIWKVADYARRRRESFNDMVSSIRVSTQCVMNNHKFSTKHNSDLFEM